MRLSDIVEKKMFARRNVASGLMYLFILLFISSAGSEIEMKTIYDNA